MTATLHTPGTKLPASLPLCYHMARRRGQVGHDADDMAQAGALAMLEGRSPAWGMEDWRRHWLGRHWKIARPSGERSMRDPADPAPGPAAEAEAHDFLSWACAQTTPRRADLLRALYGGEGCRSQRDAAALLGVTESAVAHLLKQAIDDVREALT